MKLFKSSILAILALSATAMVSCDGGKDVGYVEGSQSAGAYFTSTATTYTLQDNATTFTVTIGRGSTSAASTVNLNVTEPSGLLSIPTQATFAEGALTTDLVIGYDIEQFEYDVRVPVELTINDPSIYGNGTYSFSVMRPSPFKPLGKGIYTDGIMMGLYNIEQLTYYVEVEESLTTPGIYRVKNPYAYGVFEYTEEADMVSNDPYYMVVHAEDPDKVYVEEFSTNMIWDPSLGVMSFCSYAYMLLINGNDPDLIAKNGYFGTAKNGVITIPGGTKGFLFSGTASDYADSWYTMSQGSGWRLILPGVDLSDYSATLTYKGRFTDVDEQTSLVADVTLGDDVEYALIAASTTKDMAALEQAIAGGEIESIKLTESQTVNIPVTEGGIYTIMVLTFANDKVQDVATATVEVALGGSEWETIGDAIILDGWMIGGSSLSTDYENYLLECPVQHSTSRPGVYRLIQPYGPESILGNFAEPGIYNIEVNAEDPGNVYIEPQSTGNGWFSDGISTIATRGYFTDLDPDMRGTLVDDLIMFPATTCMLTFNGEDWYSTRVEGGIMIERATPTAMSRKAVKSGSKIGNAGGNNCGVPFNGSHLLRRTVKHEKAVNN